MCWISEHPAPAYGKNRIRPTPKNPTTENQMKLNDRNAAKKMAMKICGNFVPHQDLFTTLTHPPGVSEENAKKAIKKFLDLMRKRCKKLGSEFKYILVTEKQGYWHHHLIMEDTPLDVIRELWKKATEGMRRGEENRVSISTLDPFDNFKSLAKYLVCPEKPSRRENPSPGEAENAKEPRRKGAQRYSCSKNLEKPVVTPQVIKRISKTEPRPPKGYRLLGWNKWCDDYGEMHAEYTCVWDGLGHPRKARRRGWPERKRD